MSYLLIHLVKDLRLEWRSKDAINSMLFFALLVVVLFSLAFDPTAPRKDLRRRTRSAWRQTGVGHLGAAARPTWATL